MKSIFQEILPREKDSKQDSSPYKVLGGKRSSKISSSSSRSRSGSREQKTPLFRRTNSTSLSDRSPSRSTELSSSSGFEVKFHEIKQDSQNSSLSFPVSEDNKLFLRSKKQLHKIPIHDSSIEFLQDKISNLLIQDQKADHHVMEMMVKLAERNLELEDQLSQKEMEIDKLAHKSESVIEKYEEIEVGFVSNLAKTDQKISKLSRVMNVAKRFQIENNSLWSQIGKLKEILSEKDREISRLLLQKGNDSRKDEIKSLKEKLNSLEHEYAVLSTNFRKSEKICRQYEKDLEGLERNLKSAEDKLRYIYQHQPIYLMVF